MLFKYLYRFYPIPLKKYPKGLQKPSSEELLLQDIVTPSIAQRRPFAESKIPGKEEQMSIKMPGFVAPETLKEEGYFTQKAKQQLEELKRKGVIEKPSLNNPEKKEH